MVFLITYYFMVFLATASITQGFQVLSTTGFSLRAASLRTLSSKRALRACKKLTPDEIKANVPVVLGLSQQHFMSQVLYSIVKLKVPDAIGDGTLTAAEIKEKLDNPAIREELLSRSLRFLVVSTGLFGETEKHDNFGFSLTTSGALLQTGVDGQPSLGCAILHQLEPCLWNSWGAFSSFLEGSTTNNAFVAANGMGPFEYYEQNPHSGAIFNEFMSVASAPEIPLIVNEFDWSPYETKTVVDVGGSYGPVMAALKSKYPSIQTISFDLAQVIDKIKVPPPGVELVSGNFFDKDSIPKTDGAIFLKHILHDWSDADCLRILNSCSRALEPGASIIIVDAVLPDPGETSSFKVPQVSLDMLMSIIGGKERTRQQWDALVDAAGFIVQDAFVFPASPPLTQMLVLAKK